MDPQAFMDPLALCVNAHLRTLLKVQILESLTSQQLLIE